MVTPTALPPRPARPPRWTLKTWVIFLAIMLPVLAGAIWLALAIDRQTQENPAIAALARSNAGGEVQVFTGPEHTVYQSLAPLPSAAAARADGKPTLVWFSTSNCGDCGRMDPFAHRTASAFTPRMVFVEKAADRDVSAARYGVSGTPTFVLIDARGVEVARFSFEDSAETFAAMIEQALQRLVPNQ